MNTEKSRKLYNMRHSAAHLLAQAVIELYPGTQLTIGPVTEDGFFYDFLPIENFKEECLERIEARMHEISKKGYKIVGESMPKSVARTLFLDNRFKLELIDSIEDEVVGVYRQGDFFDLCKGGHTETTAEVKYFKLLHISGSYWRGDREGQRLQRISGVAFLTEADLNAYLEEIEVRKLSDHRRLGRQLDLFSFHDEAAGFPFFHEKGTIIFNKLIEYSRYMQRDEYKEIRTPLVMDEKLWHQSGHYDHYKENMYFTEVEGVSHCIRPMNCPSSFMVYAERPHSYRELPIRYSEYGLVHRFELSGVLHGLMRVRGFTQDDAHLYCTEDQLESELIKIIRLAQSYYKKFEFTSVKMYLSSRPESSMGTDAIWNHATEALRAALVSCTVDFEIDEGGGAFYGPKIDMKIQDSLGRTWQCGTIQIDFNGPINFNLEYIEADQVRKRPVVIHRAIYGSIERFMGIILEHFKGQLPFFIAPVQARILVITDTQRVYAEELAKLFKAQNNRVEVDGSGDQISAQVKRAQLEKIPWMLVVGKKEQEHRTVTLRNLDGRQEFGLAIEEILIRARTLDQF